MRIVLYELRKIFAARYIIVAVIFAVLFLPLYMREGVQIVGAYSYNAYKNKSAFSPEPTKHWFFDDRAKYYETFKWFTDNFGYKIDDEDIAKMDCMTFPELDKYIAGSYEFAYNNIHSTAELAEYADNYELPYNCLNGALFDSMRGDTFYDMAMREAMQLSVNNLYLDRYIAENEFLRSNGIYRYIDYDVMDSSYLDDNSSVDIQLVGSAYEEIAKIRAQMKVDYDNGTFVIIPEYEILHEQWQQFCVCYKIRRLYLETRKNPIYYIKPEKGYGVYTTLDMSHTLLKYHNDWYDKDRRFHDSKEPSFWETISSEEAERLYFENSPSEEEERIAERVTSLGNDYFYVRNDEILNGWTGTGFGIIILSAVVCIIFAAPYAVADKRNIVPLQFTTKCGRNIERKKLCAVVLMAVIVSLTSAIAVLLIMPHDVCAQWFGLPLTSFSVHDLLWLDMNMWQYIALYIGISFLVNIGTAVISYTVCGLAGNIISAVCISVPLIIAELLLWTNPLSHIFSLPESAVETPVWCMVIIFVAVLGAGFITKRSRKPIL